MGLVGFFLLSVCVRERGLAMGFFSWKLVCANGDFQRSSSCMNEDFQWPSLRVCSCVHALIGPFLPTYFADAVVCRAGRHRCFQAREADVESFFQFCPDVSTHLISCPWSPCVSSDISAMWQGGNVFLFGFPLVLSCSIF